MSDGEWSPGLCLRLVIIVRAAPRLQLLSRNLQDLCAVINQNTVSRLETAFSIINMCYRAMHTSVLLTQN